jgi:biotin transport system ATP-binding protein
LPASIPGIHLHDASVTLSGKPILQGLTLTLTEPRIGIVGRNGSGKTTLLRLLAGLIAPTTGMVRLGALDPARATAQNRRAVLAAVGILFQNPDHQILFPTVDEELAFGLIQIGLSRADAAHAVAALLASEGRGHWAGAPVSTLSHGQKHYLCLLAVLAMQPATILLDEPLAGLDLPTQLRLVRKLDALPQQIITITHDPTAMAGADRVIWLEAGRIIADGLSGPVLAAFSAAMAERGASDADTDLAG